MEYAAPIVMKTPEIRQTKTYKIISDKKNEYYVLFENTGNLLYISTESKKNNSLEKIKYKNQFTLNDIQNVKFFKGYDTIEECLAEIDINKGIIKEEQSKIKLDLVIPINSKKYPEITFILLLKEKTDSEKINELYGIIYNLSEENKSLKKTKFN